MGNNNEEAAFAALMLVVLVAVGIGLLASIALFPPKKMDRKFTSRSLTGWSNTPKKLAWSETVRKVAEE